MDVNTIKIINILNPWLLKPACWRDEVAKKLPRQYIERSFLKDAASRWRDPAKVHLVVGPRQVGKSTAIWKELSQGAGRVLYLNCEEALIREWCRSPAVFADDFKGFAKQVDLVFFEEAQHLDDAALFFKGLVDMRLGVPLIVTGSSSYHLHAKTRESLAGRATRAQVTPLSLEEVTASAAGLSDAMAKAARASAIAQQQRWGSYPEVWLGEDKERLLFDLIEAFVIRDASDLFRIKHVGAFRQLVKLIAWQVGDLVNCSEWGGICGIDYNTARSYIDILKETGIVAEALPYVGGRRAEITSMPVLYFCDVGLRNAFAGQFEALDERADRGKVMENWVFAELLKLLAGEGGIHFWRSKAGSEADFVIVRGREIVGVEVKCARLSEGKISRSSRSFIEAYRPPLFFVVNRGFEGETRLGATRVVHALPESLPDVAAAIKLPR